MLEAAGQILERIGRGTGRAASDGWTLLTVDVAGAGASTDVEATAVTSSDQSMSFFPDSESGLACIELRKAMFQPGKGTWYKARFAIDESREIRAEFDYESPPFEGDLDHDLREMLEEDQRMFPRDPDALPSWHPSRPA